MNVITAPGTPEGVARVDAWFAALLPTLGVPEKPAGEMRLALYEATANVALHGDCAGEKTMRVQAIVEGGTLTVVLADNCAPFDPAAARARTLAGETLDGAPIGGLGIGLIQAYTDVMTWRAADGGNRLTLVRHLGPPSADEGDRR